jgi:hypothetical protein
MNTKIKELAATLERPTVSMETLPQFLLKFFLLSVGISVLVYLVLPVRENIGDKTETFFYLLENLLWLSLCGISAIALYFRSFPETNDSFLPGMVGVLLLTLVILAVTQHTFVVSDLPHAFSEEMSLWKGRCGIIIVTITSLQSLFLFRWAKKGASSAPALSGILASTSSAGLGCFLMQFVCAHDQSLHLLLWHFLPVFAVAYAGQKIGQKVLRW